MTSIVENSEDLVQCAVCGIKGTYLRILEHVNTFHVFDQTTDLHQTSSPSQSVDIVEVEINENNLNLQRQKDENKQHKDWKWSTEETKMLLRLYEDKKELFLSSKKTNKSLWQQIAAELNEKNVFVTYEQCDTKFKNLKKRYKSIVDNNNKSGAGAINWPFFDIMDEIFGRSPDVAPLSTASSTTGIHILEHAETVETLTQQNKKKEIKKQKKTDEEEPRWFKTYREEAQKRHDEKLHIQKQLVNILSELVKKD